MTYLIVNERCNSFVEGWNSWNHFHRNISETIIRQAADVLAASGLAAAGYQYGLFFVLFYRSCIILF